MAGKIIPFKTIDGYVGDGIKIDAKVVAESAASVCDQLVCMGYNKDGGLEVFSSHGIAESFLLASQGAAFLLNASGRVSE